MGLPLEKDLKTEQVMHDGYPQEWVDSVLYTNDPKADAIRIARELLDKYEAGELIAVSFKHFDGAPNFVRTEVWPARMIDGKPQNVAQLRVTNFQPLEAKPDGA